eukprot:8855841-Pyramimonas_sp.AAC.1
MGPFPRHSRGCRCMLAMNSRSCTPRQGKKGTRCNERVPVIPIYSKRGPAREDSRSFIGAAPCLS